MPFISSNLFSPSRRLVKIKVVFEASPPGLIPAKLLDRSSGVLPNGETSSRFSANVKTATLSCFGNPVRKERTKSTQLATVLTRARLLVSTTIIHAHAGAFSPSHASHVAGRLSPFPSVAACTEVTPSASTRRNPTASSFLAELGVNSNEPPATLADCAKQGTAAENNAMPPAQIAFLILVHVMVCFFMIISLCLLELCFYFRLAPYRWSENRRWVRCLRRI